MKKTCIALAALAAATGACAQSRLGISGLLDTSLARVTTEANGVKVSKTGIFSSGMSSNFIRFDGQEDLGSNWYAAFRLEAGVNTDSGTGVVTSTNNQRPTGTSQSDGLTFNRWAYVAIGNKDLGEIRTGRVYTAAFENFTPFDPFLTNGVGSSTVITLRLGQRNTQTALNVSNAIEYYSPHYGSGFFGRVTLALGENPSDGTFENGNTPNAGDHAAVRVGYAGGPLTVAFSTGLTKNTAGRVGTANNQGDYLNSNLAARYDLGWVRLFTQFVNERLDGASAAGGLLTGNPAHEAKTRSLLLGASFPVGAGNIKVSYVTGKLEDNIGSPDEEGRQISLGYDYHFSKRTAVYATVTRVTNNDVGAYGLPAAYVAAGRGAKSSGVGLGMRVLF